MSRKSSQKGSKRDGYSTRDDDDTRSRRSKTTVRKRSAAGMDGMTNRGGYDDDDTKSRRSSKRGIGIGGLTNRGGNNDDDNKSVMSKGSMVSPNKRPPPTGRKLPSGLSGIGKQEFAEDSAEDEESSEVEEDEEAKAQKWKQNLYYYKCPVFRVSATFLSVTQIRFLIKKV